MLKPNRITIRSPIWKNRSVGISSRYLNRDCIIRISYRDKAGNLLYPEPYFIRREDALKFPTQRVKGHTLHIIPIRNLEFYMPEEAKEKLATSAKKTMDTIFKHATTSSIAEEADNGN